MSKLFFKYGTMNSGKSLLLLAAVHNYESQGKKVILLKPNLDTRSKVGSIESRVGIRHDCIDIDKSTDLSILIIDLIKNSDKEISCILVDEAQFLTNMQVAHLRVIVNNCNLPVICYGLKNTYTCGVLFEGSSALLYFADKLEEIKTTCKCGKKATMNLRVLNGTPVYSGDIINCGDTKEASDYYIPTCSYHYFNYDKM